eukprot:CAMPEP_0185781366 /NCGR_PEP_ID=MMETSP1174-20130828/102155_1 /TAXON_ID=35687 /ORGANISM="Dictyocha speculum, Strain CCMP1381" /LENGTH=92 /DNA_ID=CAMNT_0028471319 /DNA_START=219 /DNA_END=497 /DNA_ORIENTATION=-
MGGRTMRHPRLTQSKAEFETRIPEERLVCEAAHDTVRVLRKLSGVEDGVLEARCRFHDVCLGIPNRLRVGHAGSDAADGSDSCCFLLRSFPA